MSEVSAFASVRVAQTRVKSRGAVFLGLTPRTPLYRLNGDLKESYDFKALVG
jgi:hypothetical protein